MVLVLLALAAGVAAGYACGGRLRRLASDPPVRNRLILTALGAYAAGVLGSWAWDPFLPAMSALCWFVLGFYAWLNRERRGARLLALGLVANGLVILLNGAMPVSSSAQARAGVEPAASATDRTTAVGDDTTVPWLGKVVPVAFPPRPEVVSPGDIAIAAGCAAALATGMTRTRPIPQVGGGERRRPSQPAANGHPGAPAPELTHATMGPYTVADGKPRSPRATG